MKFSTEFITAFESEFNRVGLLLHNLTPCDPEMIPGNTWAKEQTALEAQYGITYADVSKQWSALIQLWEKIHGTEYKQIVFEHTGFAVINPYALNRIRVS